MLISVSQEELYVTPISASPAPTETIAPANYFFYLLGILKRISRLDKHVKAHIDQIETSILYHSAMVIVFPSGSTTSKYFEHGKLSYRSLTCTPSSFN